MRVDRGLACARQGRTATLSGAGRPRRMTARARCESSEFVPQGELHDARLCEEAGVIAELLGKLLEVGRIVPEPGRDVKAMEVRNVENFPPELQAVLPLERQNPALAQAHVPTGVALSANNI